MSDTTDYVDGEGLRRLRRFERMMRDWKRSQLRRIAECQRDRVRRIGDIERAIQRAKGGYR